MLLFFPGCTVEVSEPAPRYDSIKTNPTMIELYRKYASSYGGVVFESEEDAKKILASTDLGNVSRIKPSIHPLYKINTNGAANHTHAFTAAAGHQDNQAPTLVSAKSMAMTAIEIACDSGLLKRIRDEFSS